MFAKLKGSQANNCHSAVLPCPVDNPINRFYKIGKQVGSAGPELSWKVFEATRKSDDQEASIFFFDKKLTEKFGKSSGKRKESIKEALKRGAQQLDRFRHPKILQLYHKVEETEDNLAFATEAIIGSLANILGYLEDRLRQGVPSILREYTFTDFEIKYGLLQLTEALLYLHYSCKLIHCNICPQSVIINKKGTWKLSGLEFMVKCSEGDIMAPVSCPAYTNKSPKMSQPDLDFMAPEIQASSACSAQSDMFSFGLLICSIFNNGRSPIQANLSTTTYTKQLELLNRIVNELLERMPPLLQDHVPSLLELASRKRPTSQNFSMIKYFMDPGVHALQYLDMIHLKDSSHKANFYPSLKGVLCTIPKKMWFQHILLTMAKELQASEVSASSLQPILYIIDESNTDEYQNNILPLIQNLYQIPKSIQATVTLLENISILVRKSGDNEVKSEILPFLFSSLDSTQPQVQCAALSAITKVVEYLDEAAIKRIVIPKARLILDINDSVQVQTNILLCIEKVIDNLEKNEILDEVLPLLLEAKLTEISILEPVLNIYKHMLNDKKFGLNVNLLATKVMPTLIPIIVSPSLKIEEFNFLAELLQEMLTHINTCQRNKIKLERISSFSTERYPLQHNIDQPTGYPHRAPGLKFATRRQSISVDDVLKTTISSNASSLDLNCLRVQTNLNYRRHSDNAIEPPRILIGSSSPSYGSESLFSGGSSILPRRRHSSVNPNDISGMIFNIFPKQCQKTNLNTNFKLDFPFFNRLGSGRTSPSRGRRYSVSSMMNQSPNSSSNLLNQIGSATNFFR